MTQITAQRPNRSGQTAQANTNKTARPTIVDKLPEGAFRGGQGWRKLEIKNDTEEPINIQMYFHMPEANKFRQVRFPARSQENPRFYPTDSKPGGFSMSLKPGESIGWNRRGFNDFAVAVTNQEGNNLSNRFSFSANSPTVSVLPRSN